ncbi:hypothetical protein C8Q80DRAFT_1268144 [Daedaleopsis nitida]|nr:hypothetical protein C8Q80DRAFT_1268144 [Daedaleopsis nitida]
MDTDSPASIDHELEFVAPTRLPDQLSDLNARISERLGLHIGNLADDILKSREPEYFKITMILTTVQVECQNILLSDRNIVPELVKRYLSRLDVLDALVKTAVKDRDFSQIMRITVFNAFEAPFIGDSCKLLKKNIEEMYKTSIAPASAGNPNQVYTNYASIIQSSGSGKSEEDKNGAYPPPDSVIRDLLTEWGKLKSNAQTYQNYLCFLAALFECAAAELDVVIGWNNASGDHPAIWRRHLAQPDKRDSLYMQVQTHAEEIIKTIEHDVQNMVYFDEAHVLADAWMNRNNDRKVQQMVPLDLLVRAINDVRGSALFALLLFTQSKLDYLAPSSSFARSARYQEVVATLHPPITETPFDCFDDKAPVNSLHLTEEILSDVGFLACFGRPMWAGLIYDDARRALDQATGKSVPTSGQVNTTGREERYRELLEFAAAKLLHTANIHGGRGTYSHTAQTAILDVRIALSFEAGRPSAHQREMDLVSSHMRTVYSIPRSREYMRSGYSSEPILAEAAARQLHFWRNDQGSSPDPALVILGDNLAHDLLSRGEICEAVGRLLLIRARDRAALTVYGEENINFSRPVPVVAFIEALFPKKIADEFLNSYPDNLRKGKNSLTLRKAFEDAVINFTHFTKWADDSAPTQEAALGAYIRHAAAICRNNAPMADAFIPILWKRTSTLTPESMTGLILQFKWTTAGGAAAYAIAQEQLPKPMFPASADTQRPYMTMVMDLGVTPSPSLLAQTPTNADAQGAHTRKVQLEKSKYAPGVSTDQQSSPSKAIIQPAPTRKLHHPRSVHPRYGIYVCGCSPSVYGVIDESERSKYKHIIRTGDLLGEHPRQDRDTLSGVRRQKPFMFEGLESWHWLLCKASKKQGEGNKGQLGLDTEDVDAAYLVLGNLVDKDKDVL